MTKGSPGYELDQHNYTKHKTMHKLYTFQYRHLKWGIVLQNNSHDGLSGVYGPSDVDRPLAPEIELTRLH